MDDKAKNELQTLDEYIDGIIPSWVLTKEINNQDTYFKKLSIISKYYKDNEVAISEMFIKNKSIYFNSYPIDWSVLFTPIEALAWHSIRNKGGIVLYPQYPVLNYHLDFANPGLKIALELDGKKFHDLEKDLVRDNILRDNGWIIYRIPGKEMTDLSFKNIQYLRDNDIYDINDIHEHLNHWIFCTGDGVIEAIKVIYFSDHNDFYNTEVGQIFLNLCDSTLRDHQLTKQKIDYKI